MAFALNSGPQRTPSDHVKPLWGSYQQLMGSRHFPPFTVGIWRHPQSLVLAGPGAPHLFLSMWLFFCRSLQPGWQPWPLPLAAPALACWFEQVTVSVEPCGTATAVIPGPCVWCLLAAKAAALWRSVKTGYDQQTCSTYTWSEVGLQDLEPLKSRLQLELHGQVQVDPSSRSGAPGRMGRAAVAGRACGAAQELAHLLLSTVQGSQKTH